MHAAVGGDRQLLLACLQNFVDSSTCFARSLRTLQAVVTDNQVRVWYSTPTLDRGLLFGCEGAVPSFDQPLGALRKCCTLPAVRTMLRYALLRLCRCLGLCWRLFCDGLRPACSLPWRPCCSAAGARIQQRRCGHATGGGEFTHL